MRRLLTLWALLGCYGAHATGVPANRQQQAKSPIDSVYFNLGTHTEYFNAVQEDASGNTRKFDFAPTIGVGLSVPWVHQLIFLPELNWVLPQKPGGSRIIKNIFMMRADLGYNLLSYLRVRAGTSLMWLNQHGQGGSTNINNGSSTSTFYYPEENRSSLNNTFDLGLEAFYQRYSARLQTYTYSLFKDQRRQLSYTIFLTYYWDQ
ncbi:MAG TPA: hypothetical protein VNJ01_09555 [Bacteriovoracaceae bacterium]|nr:hypothetical protein [Bacteriovoracaceae bacterium]